MGSVKYDTETVQRVYTRDETVQIHVIHIYKSHPAYPKQGSHTLAPPWFLFAITTNTRIQIQKMQMQPNKTKHNTNENEKEEVEEYNYVTTCDEGKSPQYWAHTANNLNKYPK